MHQQADVFTIVAKTSDFHVTKALNISLEDNLDIIYGTIAYLKDKGLEVFLDAEHFFDGYKSNAEYSLLTLVKAKEAGADMLMLCDTNGGTLPHEITEIILAIKKEIIASPLGVHFHNDAGVAVANSIAAIEAGAVSVQGTINGLGERCGNTDLTTFIPNIVLKMNYDCQAGKALTHLTEVSRFVSETANVST